MTYTKEDILKRYQSLPQDVQDAIFSVESADIIQEIAKENGLNVEEMGVLADETGLLMLGITHPNEFISNISKRLKIDREKAQKIAEALNKQIFSKIRESLKKIHGVDAEEKTAGSGEQNKETEETSIIMPRVIKPQVYIGKNNEQDTAIPEEPEDQPLRSPAETIQKEYPETTEEKPKPPKRTYPQGQDPYREPLN